MTDQARQQYVILPRRGIRGRDTEAGFLLRSIPPVVSTAKAESFILDVAGGVPLTVIDSIGDDGPKLVEMTDESVSALRSAQSEVQIAPVVYYELAAVGVPSLAIVPAAGGVSIVAQVRSAATGAGIQGATVLAFTNFALRQGDMGTTDAHGKVALSLGGSVLTIERLYVYPPGSGFWGAYATSVTPTSPLSIDLEPVDLSFADALRHFYPAGAFDASTGVTVGVIDTGVENHPDLNLIGGRNTVTGEPASHFGDPDSHGTHVAGIVGANGSPPSGLRGVSPGARLRAYRVFGASAKTATNYAIIKAMVFAVADGCDILNLSLGGPVADPVVQEAVLDARENGVLVVAAAGNNDRARVSFPAAHPDAVAVSAMGRVGTFPAGSIDESSLAPPRGSDPDDFMASFSNIGPQIDLTGPGVGILSTAPGPGYAPMSGTSMATPAVAGVAAALLSNEASVFGMARDRNRSDSIARLLFRSAGVRGFGLLFEGMGLPSC